MFVDRKDNFTFLYAVEDTLLATSSGRASTTLRNDRTARRWVRDKGLVSMEESTLREE